MLKQSLTLLSLVILTLPLLGQNVTQTIAGTVIDEQSEIPLIGATVELMSGDLNKGTVTDPDGYFRLEEVTPGRHTLRISYLGYEPRVVGNVVLSAGKSVILNVQLEESVEQLDEIVITAQVDKSKTVNEMTSVSARTFSVEEVNRFSGGRSDVARLAANFAGVSTANDARNDIVIRGNSPTGVLWRLEGIPIPNPNHYATLGTTGGPVSALNPNLLKNSDFLTSAFPAEYGNAQAGVFDLGFRSGNRDESEFMFQVGAVSGIEAMAEGPMNKKNNGSYIISGRYSFVGLASDMGLNIGTNASPQYQDISFKLDFGSGKAGQFSLFGIGGTSDIEFLHDELEEDDLFALEDEDAFAESGFGVVGLKHNYIIGNDAYVRTILSGSVATNTFRQDRLFNIDTEEEFAVEYQNGDNTESRLALSSYLNKKFNARFSGRIGILIEQSNFDIAFQDREERPDLDGDGFPDLTDAYRFDENMILYQAYAQGLYKFNKSWTLNGGLHVQYLTLNETSAVEPRVALQYHFNPKQTLSLGYGLHHQTQPLPILLLKEPMADGTLAETNRDLEFTRNQHLVLGFDWQMADDWRLKAEAYYQFLTDVPVEPEPSSFSILNVGADFGFPTDVYGLQNEGTGFNRGIEITLEKFFSKGYYGLFTGSFYQSKYEGSDGVERNTAFDNSYVLNALTGKEFKLGSSGRDVLTIDTKITFAGGRRYTPIDLVASEQAGFEVRDEANAYSERFDPYFRWDLKFGVRRNSKSKRISHHIFFDFQNVTNAENIFIRRYNRLDNTIGEVNQIGFFPDFMYRIQF